MPAGPTSSASARRRYRAKTPSWPASMPTCPASARRAAPSWRRSRRRDRSVGGPPSAPPAFLDQACTADLTATVDDGPSTTRHAARAAARIGACRPSALVTAGMTGSSSLRSRAMASRGTIHLGCLFDRCEPCSELRPPERPNQARHCGPRRSRASPPARPFSRALKPSAVGWVDRHAVLASPGDLSAANPRSRSAERIGKGFSPRQPRR